MLNVGKYHSNLYACFEHQDMTLKAEKIEYFELLSGEYNLLSTT